MLERLFHYFSSAKLNLGQRQVIPRDQHSISRRHISHGALKTMKRLNESGFEAYLVGGGVRDLLLGDRPKDFDIATDATPEEVKRLFRGARIIGRRFRIVHVRMGREILEVTTFRAHHDDQQSHPQAHRSDEGVLLRDNVYGDVESDAARRDFTINALYYTLKNFEVHDYAGGVGDLQARLVRMIGDPETRYKEDPVRILRAVRFAAKLDFDIEKATARPIAGLAEMLEHIAPARMFEEVLKLFMAGFAAKTYELLKQYRVYEHLFPGSSGVIQSNDEAGSQADQLIRQAMLNTDQRIEKSLRVTPAFIFAVILWPALVKEEQRLKGKGMQAAAAHNKAAQTVITQQLKHTAIPKRFSIPMREIWELQSRLPRRGGKRAERLMEHPRFRAAYDFVLLREQAGEDLQGLGSWWTHYQQADDTEKASLLRDADSGKRSTSRRRSRHRPGRKPPVPRVQPSEKRH